MSLRTHLDVLEQSARVYPLRPAFKVPDLVSGAAEVQSWRSITYAQFKRDVERHARYWARSLSAVNLAPRSVVGLWLGGMSYADLLHIYGMARAGYVPQLFSLRLPSPEVIYELLAKANAQALVYDSSFDSIVSDCPLPARIAPEVLEEDIEGTELPSLPESPYADDIAMIFHTSGSTSGSPKLVRGSHKWLDAMISKAQHVGKPKEMGRQDVTVWMGSMCHIAQTFMLLGALQHGSCTIQPTKIAFSSEELVDMITRCQLNRLNQFATFLAAQLRASRQCRKLLDLLRGLDEVLYSGLMLPREEEEWAYQNRIQLKNLFGSTECGAMLLSIGGEGSDARFLRPIEGTSYAFLPITPRAESEAGYMNPNAQLLELVILSESNDCPDAALRATDGHFHTGDLFLEVSRGCYVSRGRDDDWIKSENSLRCDTKAIEDHVRATCGDVIAECIVVGNGRPSPALFVEPRVEVDEEQLKKTIIRRTRHFHSRRYLHERISSTEFIFVVTTGTLPRTATKGNIRRRAVEELFKTELDNVYGMSF